MTDTEAIDALVKIWNDPSVNKDGVVQGLQAVLTETGRSLNY